MSCEITSQSGVTYYEKTYFVCARAIAILLLSPAQAHELHKGFNAAFVPLNGTVGLTIGIDTDPVNPTIASFQDILPAGLVVASPNVFLTNGTCGAAAANFSAVGNND